MEARGKRNREGEKLTDEDIYLGKGRERDSEYVREREREREKKSMKVER